MFTKSEITTVISKTESSDIDALEIEFALEMARMSGVFTILEMILPCDTATPNLEAKKLHKMNKDDIAKYITSLRSSLEKQFPFNDHNQLLTDIERVAVRYCVFYSQSNKEITI